MTAAGQIVDYVRQRIGQPDFRNWCIDLLRRLTDIDTAIKADVAALSAGEQALFAVLRAELRDICGDRAVVEFQPIDPAIAADPYFSELYYTQTAANPAGLTVEQCYRGRGNLLALFRRDLPAGGQGPQRSATSDWPGTPTPVVWNAHVDTVAPFYSSRLEDGRVCGRGSCDDKGSVVALVAQIRLLEECRAKFGLTLAADRAYQFVIEEEMGGNGSLSASRDKRFAGWPVIVGEATANVPHPANRGALWYRIELDGSADKRINLAELAAHVVLALEGLGRQFKAEGRHPLFRPEHVQTCHGILGPFGKHPSAVSDFIPLTLAPTGQVTAARLTGLRDALDAGLAEYIARYGDKSKETDEHGQVKVPVHYELDASATPYVLKVHGKAGHMGTIHTLDCAIIKAAFLTAAVMQLNEDAARPRWTLGIQNVGPTERRLVLEGGQGFVPTHPMSDVQARMAAAAETAARQYVKSLKARSAGPFTQTSFNKLHNAAFACPVDMPTMQAMKQAHGLLNLAWPEPMGWQVSCDARIFARDGRGVMTYGPGALAQAHSANEFVRIDELTEAVAVLTLTAVHLAHGQV